MISLRSLRAGIGKAVRRKIKEPERQAALERKAEAERKAKRDEAAKAAGLPDGDFL